MTTDVRTLIAPGSATPCDAAHARALLARLDAAIAALRQTQHPTLGVLENVDDGEVFGHGFLCPYCNGELDAQGVIAVDYTTRDTGAEPDSASPLFATIDFDYGNGEEGDWEGLYYKVECCGLPVDPPAGWQFD